ncbi:MAG: tetratricopeptide repeat protein [Abditibacteriales bacterium]|nr:tetratricopeptide repeat protein [Abditibacteriales bacterium]MDW8366559.1 tetratricopeptide repeat protein [Abditibacteriales bacterium]
MLWRQSVESLMDEGYQRLEMGDYERALKIGRQLLKRHHTSGFEIAARAQWEMGHQEEAIKTLEEGVQVAPEVWILWSYLGQFYSDTERYEQALHAFRHALTCPEAAQSTAHYNLALVYYRQGDYERAWRQLDYVADEEDGPGYGRVAGLRLRLLNAMERYTEALALAREALERAQSEETDDAALASLYAERADACWRGAADRVQALTDAWQAIRLDKNQQTAMLVIREIEQQTSPRTQWYRLLVEGEWHEPVEGAEPPLGFYTTYWVAADSPEEAMDFIRRFEPEPVRPTLRLVESEALEHRPDLLKGVYGATKYAFFPMKRQRKK